MDNRALKAWTLITSCIIIIGFGHGIGPILLMELPYPVAFRKLDLASEYQYLIYPSVIFFIGHLAYAVFLFARKRIILWISLLVLWIGLFLLIESMFSGDAIGAIALISGIPFMILSGILFRYSLQSTQNEGITETE